MSWRRRAACKGRGIGPFFAGSATREGRAALTLCHLCPVRGECLEDCLEFETTDNMRIGIRGAMAPNTRSSYVKMVADNV